MFNNKDKYTENYNFTETDEDILNTIISDLNIVSNDDLTKKDISLIAKRIDDYNSGFVNTQQLTNIDYSQFKNHVFFDSAVNKVSYSFDRILNTPYDKDEFTNIKYKSKTDGYTEYALESLFPKSLGSAKFNGQNIIIVYDEQGKVLSESKENNKFGILNPKDNRFSIEFWLKIDRDNFTSNQIVFSKLDANNLNGYLCFITLEENNFYLNFYIFVNGENIFSKFIIDKSSYEEDSYHNIVINVNKLQNFKKISFLLDGNIVEEDDIVSSQRILQDKSFNQTFSSRNIPFVLGGPFLETNYSDNLSINLEGDGNLTSFNNLTGEIDELRFFFKNRSYLKIKEEMHKNIYAQKGLKLYLKFNEPKGNYINNYLVLDYSGNKIHGLFFIKDGEGTYNILQDTTSYRKNIDTPLRLEVLTKNPVLNSAYQETVNLRNKLIEKAAKYDEKNPNLIFNLMPKHYFINTADYQNLPVYSNDDAYNNPESILYDSENKNVSSSALNLGQPANNDLVKIVLIWARFFDSLKMYASSITNYINVNYDSINDKKVIGMQIPVLCRLYGIEFKEIFNSPTKQKLNKENILFEDILSDISIRRIRNILWQRFLINTQDFLKSKGTKKSIESAFLSFGIDYTKFIDIKEYSSINEITLKKNYTKKTLKKFSVSFSNSKNLFLTPTFDDTTLTTDQFTNNKLYIEINDIKRKVKNEDNSESISKGLGDDFSIEMFLNFKNLINKKERLNKTKKNQDLDSIFRFNNTQSILRIDVDNSVILSAKFKRNTRYSDTGTLFINIEPFSGFNCTINIPNINLFDNEKYFCITQKVIVNESDNELDKIQYTALIGDSGNQININSPDLYTKEIFVPNISNRTLLFNNQNKSLNLKIGEYNYTNIANLTPLYDEISETNFQGNISKIRMWKNQLSENEIFSHLSNVENIGLKSLDPYEHLICDFSMKNISSNNINGVNTWEFDNIEDNEGNKLNNCYAKTKNLEQTNDYVIIPEYFMYKIINSKFDEALKENGFNIVSYQQEENKLKENNFNIFPSYENPKDFSYNTSNKVAIDMSVVKVLNDDISKIISNINDFTKNISNSLVLYDYNYKKLDQIRESYFEKFSDKNFINYSSLADIFKYFDNIMSSILSDIIPSRIKFDGFNLVYESHLLERHKYEYKNKDSNLSITDNSKSLEYSRDLSTHRRNISYNQNRIMTEAR